MDSLLLYRREYETGYIPVTLKVSCLVGHLSGLVTRLGCYALSLVVKLTSLYSMLEPSLLAPGTA